MTDVPVTMGATDRPDTRAAADRRAILMLLAAGVALHLVLVAMAAQRRRGLLELAGVEVQPGLQRRQLLGHGRRGLRAGAGADGQPLQRLPHAADLVAATPEGGGNLPVGQQRE